MASSSQNGDVHSTTSSTMDDWMRTQPLSILQLDPADRIVLKIADERDAIQKKTFTKWVNKHLRKHWRYVQSGRKVDDLFTDLRDGLNLIALLEVLTSETLPRERGRLKVHVIQNVETCLELLRRKKVKLVNIRAEDIVDGNPKLTLGLIWTIILHFQVSEPWGEDTGGLSAKDALLQWAQRVTQGYSGVNVKNFTTSWRDGLAFNAILHRYRPDLVNWKEVKNRLDARQRLEKAFNLAEREFGVTRLLDPEDVDVQNPDEKSMMVYISSLYDALPEQPGSVKFEHDMSEYRTSAREFLQWVHRATRTMQDRSTPFNVVELRQLLSELERLKSAEIPQRLRDKQRLEQIYSELEMMFGETGQLRIEEELSSASLDRAWNALLQSLNERERYLRERTGAQSSLQDTTHRLHQGIGVVNEKLDSILYRIENAESRIKVTPPHEMIEIVDAIVYDLDALEQPIDGFFADVNTLKAERHPQANEYYQQVFGLHQRRIAYLDRCQAELNARIQKRKGEEMEHKRIESERYMSIKEKVFTRVEECILWVEKRLVDLSEMQFVEEIIELEQMFEQHKIDHHEINDFRHQVDQCIARQAEVSAEDSGSYCDLLTKLEQEYAQLRELSSGRMLDLDSLIAFIRAAHLELVWITEREELETSRNWSDISQLDLPMLQNYYKQLLHEIELREEQFNSVHNQGAALLNQGHPAVGVIETYLTTMQAQWDWLLALTQCLEIHLQDSTNLKQFMEDAKNCEQWMERQMQLLNAHYERADYSVDEGEKLLKELDEIRDMLDRYHEVLLSLIERSRIISPLWQRGERILRPIPVHALCRYEERNIVIRKGDECILLDNSDMLRWLVRTPEGVEGMVPSVVFRVPPPDERILGYIQRLQAQFERLRRLWLEKNRLIRFNMIMKMARDIRSWDLKHFLALDPAQREAIINALNDDANKFLSELDPNDPLAIRLREEIRLANDHLYKLLQMSQRGAEPDVAAKFDEKLTVILPNLEEYWRILNQRVAAPIPRDIDAWEKMIMEHKSFEDSLQSLESEIVMLQELFRQIPDPTPMQRSKMEQLLNHWENLWDLSKWYAERLKASEPVLNGIAEASHIINEHEFRLGSYDQLPANLDKLRALHSELLEIQLVLQQQQPVLDDLASNVVHLRQHVARTRFNVADHPDVDRMEDEVQQLTVRWENVCMSVIDRLKSVEIAIQILMVYRAAYENEVAWLDRVEATINNLRDPSHLRPEEYQDQLEMLISEYSSLQERTAAMENVNHEGGKYIREARVYDARIQRYFDVLEEIHRGRESMFRRTIPAPIPGADQVQKELDDLNRRFSQLASIILERRNVVQVMIQNYRRQQQEEDGRKRMEDEAARRAAEEAERLRRLREEEEARRKAAQEEADRLRRLREAEEEEARRRAKEAEDKRRREEEERERERERKRREEEERRRREEEERERERQRRKAAEEEAERLRKQREAEERERRRKEDEARRKAGEDEAARQRRLREEEEARRKREEEERERERERKRREEEERRRREEEERRRREEEERRKRQQEEEDRLRREREEIIKSRIHIPNVGGGDGRIHVKLPEVKLPETKHGHLIGEGGMEGEISEWDSTKEIPGVVTVSEHEDDMIMYAEETEVRTKFYELDAIKHMQTGEILTFVEAIRQGLLDLHSGEFFDIVSGARISLEEAVERNYVSQSFTDCLNTHYGIRDPSNGEAINLLEAIQRGIYDPECRQLRDPTTGDLLSLYDASRLGVVSMDNVHKLIKMGILKLPPLSLEHAIDQKVIDLETGTFIGRFSRETLPLRDALRNGYITVSSSLTPQIAISLTECIENRFINPNNGEFNDKNTNEKFTLRDAVGKANALINLNVREIVNTSERKRITVGEALLRNALNTRQGNFTDLAQRQSMSLLEAHEQEFIQKPLTLKDVYSKDLVDSVGRFIDGGTKKRMTLLEAIAEGLIDPDVPHIVDPESKEIMSIAEALENGVLTANGRFVPPGTPDHLTLHEAARHGWLTDPVKSSIFDVKAIKNTKTNQTLSFNEAVEAGIVQLQSERFVDLATNDSYLLPDTVEKGRLIDGQLHMILSQLSGLKDNQGNQMTVFKAIASGAINTKKGSYVDKRSNQEMSPKEAYERGFISLRGAMQLTALFNVHPSLIAVARPKKVMKKEIKRGGRSTADDQKIKMTLADAMKQGLVDAKSHKFSHGGVEMTLEDALSKGLVDTNAEWIVPAKGTGVGPTIQESVTEQVTETSQVLAPRKAVDKQSQETVTTVKRKKIKETTATGGPGGVALYRAITSGRGSLEVPVDGFHILEAERNGLIDLNSGLVSLPDSDRTLTFEEAVELGIINPKVFSVRNPKTGKSLSLVEALEQNVIDATGHMFDQKTGRKLSFQAAIDADYILVNPEQSAMDTKPAMKVIQFGVSAGAGPIMSFTPVGTSVVEETETAWSFDSTTGEVFDRFTGERLRLDEAVRSQKVTTDNLRVKDALTDRELSYADAVKWGIIDPTNFRYSDKREQRDHSFQEAAIRGLIFLGGGRPELAKEALQTHVHQQTRKVVATKEAAIAGPAAFVDYSLQKVIDLGWYNKATGTFTHPDTKKQMTLKEAIMKGLFNPYESIVVDQSTGEALSLLDAVQSGVIDANSGTIVDKETGKNVDLVRAFEMGLIRSGIVPQTLESVINSGKLNLSTGEVVSPDGGAGIALHDAISKGLIDASSIIVKDPQSGREISFIEAVHTKIIDLSRGLMINKSTGDAVSLLQGVISGTIQPVGAPDSIKRAKSSQAASLQLYPVTGPKTSPKVHPGGGGGGYHREEMMDIGGKQVMVKVIKDEDGVGEKGEYVDSSTGMKFLVQLHGDPYVTRTKTTVKSRAQVQQVELEPTAELIGIDQVRDNRTGRVMTLAEAQRAGLARVDKKGKQLMKSYAVFRSDIVHALNEGVVDASNGVHISLADAIRSKLVDIKELMYCNPVTGENVDFVQAANQGLMDVSLAEVLPKGVCNPASGDRIAVSRAIELKIINPKTGEVMNPFTNKQITWLDIVKPVYASLTMEGVYDPRKGYAVPVTSALIEGLVNPRTEVYHNPITNDGVSLSEAVKVGLIDEGTYRAITQPSITDWRTGNKVSLLKAVDLGLVDPQHRTVQLAKGHTVPIVKAVEEGKIPHDVGSRMRRVEKLTFADALGKGLIDVKSNQFTDTDSGKKLTIAQALEQGFIDTGSVESMEGIDERNLVHVIDSEEFDVNSGRIRDQKSGLYLTFRQAIDKGLIDGDSLLYEVDSGKTMTVRECADRGRIDNNGKYVDQKSGAKVNLKDAVRVGLIALIASPMMAGQAVAEAIKRRETEGFKFKIEKAESPSASPGGGGTRYVQEHVTTYKVTPRKVEPTLSLKVKTDEAGERLRSLLSDPQAVADRHFEFIENLKNKDFDIEDKIIENPATGNRVSAKDAVETGLLDVLTGEIVHPLSGRRYSIPRAVHMKMIQPNAAKNIMESLNMSLEELHQIIQTLSPRSDHSPIASMSPSTYSASPGGGTTSYVREDNAERNCAQCESRIDDILLKVKSYEQTTLVKLQRSDDESNESLEDKIRHLSEYKLLLEKQQGDVADCLASADRVSTDGAQMLSPEEFHNLLRHKSELQDVYGTQLSKVDAMLSRLTLASKLKAEFESRTSTFRTWCSTSDTALVRLMANVGDPTKLDVIRRRLNDIGDDVRAKDEDLNEITILSRRVADEYSNYSLELASSSGLSSSMYSSKSAPVDADVRGVIDELTDSYKNLTKKCDHLRSMTSAVNESSADYEKRRRDVADWLSKAERRVDEAVCDRPDSTDLRKLNVQLSNVRELTAEIVEKQTSLDQLRAKGNEYLNLIENGDEYDSQKTRIDSDCNDLERRHSQINMQISDQGNKLQSMLTQSQGVLEGLESTLRWLDESGDKTATNRPLPLNKDQLAELMKQQRVTQSDIDRHRPAIAALIAEAESLLAKDPSNHKLRHQLDELKRRYDDLSESNAKYGEQLTTTNETLEKFNSEMNRLGGWLEPTVDNLSSKELSQKELHTFAPEVSRYSEELTTNKGELETLRNLWQQLLASGNVVEAKALREKLAQMERKFDDAETLVVERKQQAEERRLQFGEYDVQKAKVHAFLKQSEDEVDRLAPVGLSFNVLSRQSEDLTPYIEKHDKFRPEVEIVERLGVEYHRMLYGDAATAAAADGKKPKREFLSPLLSPSSTTSSGFSSLDNMSSMADLSPVQQEVIEMRHRYDVVGQRLKDRRQELTANLDLLNKHKKQYEMLTQWVDGQKTKFANLPLPTNREDAVKNLNDVKDDAALIQRERTKLEDFKANCHELTRLKPEVSGVRELQNQANDLCFLWEDLSEDCRRALQRAEDAKDFYMSYGHLKSWMNSKQKMISALGIVGTEPHLINAQLQQIQVLKDEFDGERSNVDVLNHCGNTLVVASPTDSAESRNVAEKLNDINSKWDDLSMRLNEREQNLTRAGEMCGGFAEKQKSLKIWIAEALRRIEDLMEVPVTSENVDAKMSEIQKMQAELNAKSLELNSLKTSADRLSDIDSDPSVKVEINSKLQAIQQPFDELTRKLDNLQENVKNVMSEGLEFDEKVKSLVTYIGNSKERLNAFPGVSAKGDNLMKVAPEFDEFYRSILDKEIEVSLVRSKGPSMAKKSGDLNLTTKLDQIEMHWDPLLKATKEKKSRFDRALDVEKQFSMAADGFDQFLSESNEQLNALRNEKDVYDVEQFERRLRSIEDFRADVANHTQEYKSTQILGEQLIACTDSDQIAVQDRLDKMRDTWTSLNEHARKAAKSTDAKLKSLNEFNSALTEARGAVATLDDRVARSDAQDSRALEKLKLIRDDLNGVQTTKLKAVKDASAKMKDNSKNPDSDFTTVDTAVALIVSKVDGLNADLSSKVDQLESASDRVRAIRDDLTKLAKDAKTLDADFAALGPLARDADHLKSQKFETEDFVKTLSDKNAHVENASKKIDGLRDDGFEADAEHCVDSLARTKDQLTSLDQQAAKRVSDLDKMLEELTDLFDDADQAHNGILEILSSDVLQKPASNDLPSIRKQLETLKIFKDGLNPMQKRVEDILAKGRFLIKSAGPNVDTSLLESEMNKLSEGWNELKSRVNEREQKLDRSLLGLGNYQESLSNMLNWLDDSENLLANQKLPSADHKVVKEQLAAQKLLQKLIDDKQPNVEAFKNMVEQVAQNAEDSERQQLHGSLDEIVGRYDALCADATTRRQNLHDAQELAEQWAEHMQPLIRWFENTEKRLQQFDNVPTNEEKLAAQIDEHKKLHEDIENHRQSMDNVVEISEELRRLVSPDDADELTQKCDDVATRYDRLGTTSLALGKILGEMADGIGTFLVKTEDLKIWLDDMEVQLSKFDTISAFMDTLTAQREDIMTLAQEICTRQTDVTEIIKEGRELCKHTNSDDASALHAQLESMKSRYSILNKTADDKLDLLINAYPLAATFHDAHQKLSDFLNNIESAFSLLDQATIEEQQDVLPNMEEDINAFRPMVDQMKSDGARLCGLTSKEGSKTIEEMSARISRRFDAVSEQYQRRAERLSIARQHSLEVIGDMDNLIETLQMAESHMINAGAASSDPIIAKEQLKEQRMLNDEVNSHRARSRDLIAAAKRLQNNLSGDDKDKLRDQIEVLKELTDSVCQLSAERLSVLEEALPLAEHFQNSLVEFNDWLTGAERELESAPSVMPGLHRDQLKKQFDHNKTLQSSIQEIKPLADTLNKTGKNLEQLCNDDDKARVNDSLDQANHRFDNIRENVRDRGLKLDDALNQSSQFSDKLENMLNSLTAAADHVRNPDPIAAHPDAIRDQIHDNCALMEELDQKSSAFQSVKESAVDIIRKADPNDPAVEEIRAKIQMLDVLWDEIQTGTDTRGRNLVDTLKLAELFWGELQECVAALRDLAHVLERASAPACELDAIRLQQEEMRLVDKELHDQAPKMDSVKEHGEQLLRFIGEPEKPDVQQKIDELSSVWETVTAAFHRRNDNLIEAMEKAMNFHEMLNSVMNWLADAEQRYSSMQPISSNLIELQAQIEEVGVFKDDLDKHTVDLEQLNQQSSDLAEGSSPDQALAVKMPLEDITSRWDKMSKGLALRQQKLERALLKMGQFEQASNQLIDWMDRTDQTLNEIRPVPGDLKQIEIEFAKLKVIANDVHAHQPSVDTLTDAGRKLIEGGHVESPEATQKILDDLSNKWILLQQKLAAKSVELEDAKKDAESFANQVHDWLRWLNDVDNSLSSNKAVGGLPETAQEQLDKFLVLYNEMDQYRPKISEVLENGENFILKSPENASSALAHNIALLRQKWDAVATKANDRKTKLEIALVDAIEYDEMLKQFVDWLTKAEQYLNRQDPVSRLMEPLTEQMKEHRMFQEDVQAEKEIAMELEKKGTKLKYYCQKQDTILIKNLLVSAQHRWDKVVSRTADRTKQLDVGYNETKDFYDAWQTLCEWLDQKRKWLEDEQTTSVPTNAEKIREYLNKHKEFQRELGAMQPTYDSTSKSGKLVKDHAPKVEQGPLQDMINMMRDKWSALSNMAIERQRKLEEALLFSGHFNEAVDALLDWLTKVEPTLAEDRLVHGDLDTVTGLLDDHKTFRKELEAREANVETIRKAADQLMQAGDEESNAEVESHLNQVNAKWEVVKGLATVADGRLSDAKTMADHFHRRTHAMLEWLSDIETKLKFAGAVSEDENQLQKQLDSLKNLQDELEMQKPVLDDVLELGDKILEKAHPDAVDPMKHWQIILQARWDEVSSWAQDRQQRSKDQMTMLHDRDELLDNLLHWLHEKETQLMAADEIELPMLPEAAPEVERLLEEHLEFEQELSSRQPEIEEVTKGRKKAEKPPEHESTATKPKSTAAAPLTRHISVRLKNPKAQKVADKWGNVWLSSMQRKTRLTDLLNRLRELHRLRDFDFDDWRKRYMAWMQHKKSRVMDFFRRQDKDNDGRVTRKEFIEGILASRFPTTQLEMEKVADIFDKDRDGYIDYKEFVAALKPNPEAKVVEKGQERVHIQKEVQRQIQMCTCHHKYKIQEVGEGKYKFGEQLRLVRILRSTVMVRVGGGWVALDEFLVKNDPCRAKGRTNIELREKFILPDGASQTMTYFNRKGSNRSPGSHASSSSGSSFATPGAAGHSHIHSHTHKVTPGPIMKIREKTERSMPMSKTAKIRSPLTNGAASANSSGGTPDSEVFSIMSNERRSSGDLLSPNEARSSSRRGSGVVNGAATSGSGSRPPSRAGSDIPVFKPPSRPPSRAGSDVSDASINSRDSSTTPSRIPSAQRKPKSAQSTTKKI